MRLHTPLTLGAMAAAIGVLVAAGATSHAQATGPLSTERYAALDAVYASSVGLEEGASTVGDLRAVCQALDRGDRLLASQRKACLSIVKVSGASDTLAACQTQGGCVRVARRLRMRLTENIVALRAANRVVAVEVPRGACRTELTASASLLSGLRKLRDGVGLLERGMRTRSSKLLGRALVKISEADALLAQQPSSRQSQATFQSVCAPPPAPVVPPVPQPAAP
jgi:hypothetical protein